MQYLDQRWTMIANCTTKHPQGDLKNSTAYTEGIRIYTGTFRTSSVETMHAEAYDLALELRRNDLGLDSCIN